MASRGPDLSEPNGLPHPFLLDDVDDQSRLLNSDPQILQKSVPKPMPVESSAAHWFGKIVLKRKYNAALIHAAISTVLFFACAACLQASLLHPFAAILGVIKNVVSISVYLFMLLYAIIDGALVFAVGFFLLRFDIEKRAYLFLLVVTSGVISFQNTFRFNFQLVFPAIELSPGCHLQAILQSEREKAWRTLFLILKWTLVYFVIAGFPIFGWSIFLTLFDIRLYFSWTLLSFMQLFSHLLGVSILKGFILQRHTFELPPPYLMARPNAEGIPNLMNAMESSSVNLKAFALWDLRDLSIKNHDRRAIVYALSQPGGHPRNWNAVKDVCMRILNSVKIQIEHENRRIQQQTYASLKGLADEKDKSSTKGGSTILLASQLYKDQNLRQRLLSAESRDRAAAAGVKMVKSWRRSFMRWLSDVSTQHFVFSSYEGNLSVLCIESLGMLIWYSYEEDRYGVVQKDLRSIMSALLQLSVLLDRYIRNNKQLTHDVALCNLAIVNALDSTVGSAITRISSKFGGSLRSIGLSPHELDVLDMIVGSSRGFPSRDESR